MCPRLDFGLFGAAVCMSGCIVLVCVRACCQKFFFFFHALWCCACLVLAQALEEKQNRLQVLICACMHNRDNRRISFPCRRNEDDHGPDVKFTFCVT